MPDAPDFCRSSARGFTLLEIMIAIFILGVVLTTIYAAYTGTLRVIKDIEDESLIYKMARTTLDRMTRDLTSLQRFDGKFFLRSERKGIGVSEFGFLTFWSASHLVFERDEQSGAPASISTASAPIRPDAPWPNTGSISSIPTSERTPLNSTAISSAP